MSPQLLVDPGSDPANIDEDAGDRYEQDRKQYTQDQEKQQTKTTVQTGEADDLEFPEGGKGWLVILGCGLGSFMGFGMINSYGVFQTHYETVLYSNVSSSKLSIIGACQASILYFFAPLMIPLVHAFGIRQILILGCSMMNGSKGKELLDLVFLLHIFVSLGGVIWPIIFKNMIGKHGFEWTVRTIVFLYIPLGLAVIFLIPQKLDDIYVFKEETISNSKWNNEKIKQLPLAYQRIFKNWTLVIKDPRFLLILVSNLIGAFGSYPAIFYIDFFSHALSPNSSVSSYITVIYNALGGPGRILPALLADRIGRVNVLLIWLFWSAIAVLALWIPSIKEKIFSLYVFFVAFLGFTAGPYFSLHPACLGQIFGIRGSEPRMQLFMITASPGAILGCIIAGSFVPVDSNDRSLILVSFNKVAIYSGLMLMA
ncbi:unnamed protein product, partial [Wickerhamomyces anomalus]